MHLSYLCEDIETRIQHLATTYKLSPETIRELSTIDPTPVGKFLTWICKNYTKQLIRDDDRDKIKSQLKKFETIKNKQEFKTKHPTDINQYDPTKLYETLEEFGEESGRQEKQKGRAGQITLPTGSELVLDKPPYQVIKITDPKASETLCSGTSWCTANAKTAEGEYLKKGPLYLIYKNGERIYLIHYEVDQFKDLSNKNVPTKTKFKLVDLLAPITGKTKETDPYLAYSYARDVIGGRFPEAEATIAKDPRSVYLYAYHAIKGRFPEGEAIIAKDPDWAHLYAKDIIKRRWPEGEAAIAKDPYRAYLYARDVIKRRWPEAEATIAKDPYRAYGYAKDVIGGRWPEIEAVMSTDPRLAYNYAKLVIKGRFPEGEAAIAKDPHSAYLYARDTIKGRFPEAEATIAKDPELASKYAELCGR